MVSGKSLNGSDAIMEEIVLGAGRRFAGSDDSIPEVVSAEMTTNQRTILPTSTGKRLTILCIRRA